MKLNIPGEDNLNKKRSVFGARQLPSKIVFVGGGYISFEFAHIAARAGARATIVHRGTRPLKNFDPYLVDILLQRTRELGIEVLLQTKIDAIGSFENNHTTGFIVRASSTNEKYNIDADIVVHGAGRVPEIDDLDLGNSWCRTR